MASAIENGSPPQVGLVIVTHGGSGDCLLAAAQGLVGPISGAATVCVSLAEPFDEIVRRVSLACDEADSGKGLVIFSDVYGSTPFRACLAMLDGSRPIEIVCGINLPMLVKLATVDRRGLRPVEVAEILKEVGKRSIRLGSELTGKIAMPKEERH